MSDLYAKNSKQQNISSTYTARPAATGMHQLEFPDFNTRLHRIDKAP